MGIHVKKLNKLRDFFIDAIKNKIYAIGKDSEVNDDKCIKVTPPYECDSIGYLIKECHNTQFIDEMGLYYSYDAISTDELAELVDLIRA